MKTLAEYICDIADEETLFYFSKAQEILMDRYDNIKQKEMLALILLTKAMFEFGGPDLFDSIVQSPDISNQKKDILASLIILLGSRVPMEVEFVQEACESFYEDIERIKFRGVVKYSELQ